LIQDHKDVQDLKANSRHREEVHGPGHFEVISQEGQPGLGLVRSSPSLDHILPDGVWAGWIETEQHQMSMDGFGCPPEKPQGRLILGRAFSVVAGPRLRISPRVLRDLVSRHWHRFPEDPVPFTVGSSDGPDE